ncbi:MAG: hypothetical protein P8181_17435, partial [bacterium]
NAVGSLLYGPILAAFFVGMATRVVSGLENKAAVLAGIGANILLWRLTGISWLWWNLAGFAVTVAAALGLHLARAAADRRSVDGVFLPSLGIRDKIRASDVSVAAYTLLIILVAYGVQQLR